MTPEQIQAAVDFHLAAIKMLETLRARLGDLEVLCPGCGGRSPEPSMHGCGGAMTVTEAIAWHERELEILSK